jgi:beta-glucosidase
MRDIESIVKELTLEEKLGLLEGSDMGFTMPVERLGIPKILMVDGPHGVRVVKGTTAESGEPYTMNGEMEQATAFPCEAAVSSTWNTELVKESGRKMGEECSKFGVGVLLAPGADGKRSPLGGRNFEYYSEDPYLSGRMASAFIQGIQSEGVGACMKHYVLNDQETRRMSVDVHVDERTLREIYVKPFEIAVREASPWTVMASYNKEGGTYVTENEYLLNHILREELQYEGAVISDWSAVKNKLESVKAGLDIQMPGPSGQIPMLRKAVESGELSEETVDCHVRRVLELVEKVTRRRRPSEVDWKEHHRLAVTIAEEGMVLLKNEENMLPLAADASVAVIGELAIQPNFAGSGSATLLPKQLDIPLDELRKVRDVVYAQGYHINETSGELLAEAEHAAAGADVAVVFLGNVSSEGMDRTTLALPEAQLQLVRRVAGTNRNIVLVVMSGSAVEYRRIEPLARAILHTWIPGEGCGTAIADILTGKANPSGKLTETFPVYLENTPAYENFPGFKDDVCYHEGILTGYRYYDTKKIPVQYPFGYGLSYTTFAYRNMRLSAARLGDGESLDVFVDVTNTGSRQGQEVVQVYVADKESYLFRPEKELKGFAKVALLPGETKTVIITLEPDAFSYYVPSLHKFAVESGDFEILAGASCSDIRVSATLHVTSSVDVRSPLQESDLFIEFLRDDRYRVRAEEFLEKLHMEENHPFYHLVLGGSLTQFLGIGEFLKMDGQAARAMVDELLERKRPENKGDGK